MSGRGYPGEIFMAAIWVLKAVCCELQFVLKPQRASVIRAPITRVCFSSFSLGRADGFPNKDSPLSTLSNPGRGEALGSNSQRCLFKICSFSFPHCPQGCFTSCYTSSLAKYLFHNDIQVYYNHLVDAIDNSGPQT